MKKWECQRNDELDELTPASYYYDIERRSGLE